MRLSIIALASFIVCAVFASPITSGRDPNSSLALSRRGPGAKPAAKPAAKSATKPGAKSAAKPGTKSAAKPGAKHGAKPGAKSAAKPGAKTGKQHAIGKSCSIRKRSNEEIVKAVNMALEKSGSGGRGSGRGAGKVYPLTFGGQSAVIKMVGPKQTEADVEKEVKNLVGVHQYLAWAIREGSDGKKQYFIIMKHMGKTPKEWMAEDTSLKQSTFTELREETAKRYVSEFKATNPDTVDGNNIVYQRINDKWEVP